MKEEWENIEGKPFRIDVGSTTSEAEAESTPANVLCLTKEARVVMNGVRFSDMPMTLAHEQTLSKSGTGFCGNSYATDPYIYDSATSGLFYPYEGGLSINLSNGLQAVKESDAGVVLRVDEDWVDECIAAWVAKHLTDRSTLDKLQKQIDELRGQLQLA